MELEDGEVVTLDAATWPAARRRRSARTIDVDFEHETADTGGFDTFMRKEIAEQPARGRADAGRLRRGRRSIPTRVRQARVAADRRLRHLLQRGARRPATLIEAWAGLPGRGRGRVASTATATPLVGAGDLVLGITQSGETADTLAAMRAARERGALVLALTNVAGSQATREADVTLLTRAGLEIGVAATKTFTAQVAALRRVRGPARDRAPDALAGRGRRDRAGPRAAARR